MSHLTSAVLLLYVDPGGGLLTLQLFISSVLGLFFYLARPFNFMKRRANRRAEKSKEEGGL